MLKVFSSHIQTHAGLLIAIIIGNFTLVSRFADFYQLRNDVITFGLLLSLLAGATCYLFLRILYWAFCDNCAVIARYSSIEKIQSENLREVKNGKAENEKERITQTHALALFIKGYLKDPTQFDSNAKLTFYHKLAGLNKFGQITAVLVTILLSFVLFLLVNGFLWY